MRQICPSCFKSIELPESAAGTTATCPQCGEAFAVPAGYAPTVEGGAARPDTYGLTPTPNRALATPEPPPPGYIPPPHVTTGPVRSDARSTTYEHTVGFTLSARVLEWVPVGCLTLVFALTFFSWVGAFPGGYRIFTQSPWQAFFGTFSTPLPLESVHPEATKLEEKVHGNILLLLVYLVCLIAAVALGWAERAARLTDPHTTAKSLGWVRAMQPRFAVLMAGLAAASLAAIVVQMSQGFGLETAIAERIAEDKTPKPADGQPTPSSLPATPFADGQAKGKFSVSGTTACDLALLAHVVALAALAKLVWLQGRGNKMPPRVSVQW